MTLTSDPRPRAFSSTPNRTDESARQRQRILETLARRPYPEGRAPSRRRKRQDERWSWSRLRQAIGGSVRSEQFRRIVDALIESGDVVEVWEEADTGRLPRHFVVLVERWQEHSWGRVLRVRARPDVDQRPGSRSQILGRAPDDLRFGPLLQEFIGPAQPPERVGANVVRAQQFE